MNEFTFEEMNLMVIYNASGTREGLIAALTEMRGYLDADETGLMEMTDWGCGQKLGPTNMVQEASPCILVKIE